MDALTLWARCDWVVIPGKDEVFGTPPPHGSINNGFTRFFFLNLEHNEAYSQYPPKAL